MRYLPLLFLSLLLLSSCQKEEKSYALDLPPGFPEVDLPEDNLPTPLRVELGKRLFFDPILSRDSSISCGSCHFRRLGFADDKVISPGIEGRLGFRNAPILTNLIYRENFFFDGGVPNLELQVVAPVEDENEMDFHLGAVVERLARHPEYAALLEKAYPGKPLTFAFTRAIASYERTLLTGQSAFDRYYYQGDSNALDSQEKRGWQLFQDKGCRDCHSGPNFSNEEFINIGLYADYDYNGDPGRRRVTALDSDIGQFKVPSLRNIALTAPYMHDGSMQSLEEVVDFFASGGKAHFNKNPQMQAFALSPQEKADLIAFLESLTDWDFVQGTD